MRIAVCVKQIIDTEAVIELDAEGQVITEDQTMVMDPYGEFAVERAVSCVEEMGGEVVLVCIGDDECASTIRHGLAMGADTAVLVEHSQWRELDPAQKAAALAHVVKGLDVDMVMGGWKSGDTANAQVMGRLAAKLGWPLANMATELAIGENTVTATCEVDDGVKTYELALPVVISAQQGLAEPRYPSVRDVMQARRKKYDTIDASEIEWPAVQLTCEGMGLKPTRSGGRVLEGAPEEAVCAAVELLRAEAKVI